MSKIALVYMIFLFLQSLQLPAQEVAALVYREKAITAFVSSSLYQHPLSSTLYVEIHARGLYRVDTTSWELIQDFAVTKNPGYEYSHLSGDCRGDMILSQRGSSGSRRFRIDSAGDITLIAPPNFSPTPFDSSRKWNSVSAAINESTGNTCYSLDCGTSWVCDSFNTRAVGGLPGAAISTDSSGNCYITRQGLGNVRYPLNISTRRPGYAPAVPIFGLIGTDSVMVMRRATKSSFPDTVCFAAIRDGLWRHCATTLSIPGIGDSIAVRGVEFVSTDRGDLLAFHPSGWYALYESGVWRLVGRYPLTQSLNSLFSSDSGLDSIFLYNHVNARSRVVLAVILLYPPYEAFVLDSSATYSSLMTQQPGSLSNEWSQILGSGQSILHSQRHGYISVNSLARSIADLQNTSMLFGFTDSEGHPLVVPFNDCLLFVDGRYLGKVRHGSARGEPGAGSIEGPRIQSSKGLRTPFVGKTEVIVPGTSVKALDRSGFFTQTLDKGAATAAFRLSNGTLLMGSDARIRSIRPNGDRDTFDLQSLLPTPDSLSRGFVSSISQLPSGRVVCYISGLRLLNLTTLGDKALASGGIVYSDDEGRSWEAADVPMTETYMLGSARTRTGTLLASVTSVVRDTSFFESDDSYPVVESKSHTMQGRVVLRSTNDGATWQEVYRSTVNRPYRLIGGDGVVTDSGSVLLMTPDGLIESFDDGLTWSFHDLQTDKAGTIPISVFKHPEGGPVFYCTNNGLYSSDATTSVLPIPELTIAGNLQVCSWQCHRDRWETEHMKLVRLYNILGEEVPNNNPSAPGVYCAYLDGTTNKTISTIIVTDVK